MMYHDINPHISPQILSEQSSHYILNTFTHFPAFLYKGTITDKHIACVLFSYSLPGINSFPQSLNPKFYGATKIMGKFYG